MTVLEGRRQPLIGKIIDLLNQGCFIADASALRKKGEPFRKVESVCSYQGRFYRVELEEKHQPTRILDRWISICVGANHDEKENKLGYINLRADAHDRFFHFISAQCPIQ